VAIFHLAMQNISRGKGKNAVSAAAYRSGSKLKDETQDMTFNYLKKQVDETYILAPSDSPNWVFDREKLWNEVERKENRKNSRLCKEFNVALPVELTKEENIKLGLDFSKKMFLEKGIVTDVCFHELDSHNPHFHVMIATREISKEGFTKKNRDWDKPEFIEEARALWADMTNERLQEQNINQKIYHKSLKKQGFNLEATKHQGYGEKGQEIKAQNEEIKQRNVETFTLVQELKEVKKEANVIRKEVIKMELKQEQAQHQEGYQELDKVKTNIKTRYKENVNVASLTAKKLQKLQSIENYQRQKRFKRQESIMDYKIQIQEHKLNLDEIKEKKQSFMYKVPFSPYRKKVRREIMKEKIKIKQSKRQIKIEKLKMKKEKEIFKNTVRERKQLQKANSKTRHQSNKLSKVVNITKKIQQKLMNTLEKAKGLER